DEQERLLRKYTDDMAAYDDYLRGLEYLFQTKEEANALARQMFERAVDADPDFAAAYGQMGLTYWLEWSLGWSQDLQSLERAFELAQRAIALDDSLSEAYRILGEVKLWKKQHEEAIGLVKKAMRLNPIYPFLYLWNLGHAYFLAEKYEEAIGALKRVLVRNPNFHPAHVYLAISFSELGRAEEAQAEASKFMRMTPSMSWEAWRQRLPYKDQPVVEGLFEGLRKAGVKPW
ncbi:MAG: tetratricopeptide repeat protein, partial [Desulfatiglandales bacterium]